MVRNGFRTREAGDLPTGVCGTCKGETYRVPAGMWLHWTTLTESCPVAVERAGEGTENGDALEGVSDGQEGAIK